MSAPSKWPLPEHGTRFLTPAFMLEHIGQPLDLVGQPLDLDTLGVAAALGYDDPLYFSRLFNKTIGMSPRAYRSSVRE
jgi:hypothetical protein